MATPKAFVTRPSSNEYAPYYEKYVCLVPEGDIVTTLKDQLDATLQLMRPISDSDANKRYEPGKWSIKEVLGHIIDTERICAYRALRFARADSTPLPGYEQDDYVRAANFDTRPWLDLLDEFSSVRQATIHFFKSLDEAAVQAWNGQPGGGERSRACINIGGT